MTKAKYRCKNCGYSGNKFIFEFTDFGYCFASNSDEPEYLGKPPLWVEHKGLGEAKIGEVIGCPRCHAWGNHNFEIINAKTRRNQKKVKNLLQNKLEKI